jgi:hypothetical protein
MLVMADAFFAMVRIHIGLDPLRQYDGKSYLGRL